jgi:8-oxo-dGTP pyrophosphatase MutT (NUDIX family)
MIDKEVELWKTDRGYRNDLHKVPNFKAYVLGFAFSENREQVVLIEKLRPEWQRGFHNGVGGKIESTDKSSVAAMVREFEEETGLITTESDWERFGIMRFQDDVMGGEAAVILFRMFSSAIYNCRTVEQEKIQIFNVFSVENFGNFPGLKDANILSNLSTLIPMARDTNFVNVTLNMK